MAEPQSSLTLTPEDKRRIAERESSGNYRSVTDTGKGYPVFGKYQLDPMEIHKYAPPGTTPEMFLGSPQLQEQVFDRYVDGRMQEIQRAGLGQYVGTVVNGVPVTAAGLFAGAHLGGVGGLHRYLTGHGNPADRFGTSVGDYVAQFSLPEGAYKKGMGRPTAGPEGSPQMASAAPPVSVAGAPNGPAPTSTDPQLQASRARLAALQAALQNDAQRNPQPPQEAPQPQQQAQAQQQPLPDRVRSAIPGGLQGLTGLRGLSGLRGLGGLSGAEPPERT